MKRIDKIFFILLTIVLVAAIFLMLYYFKVQRDECISNPLVYGAKQMTDKYGYEFVGTGFFKTNIQDNVRSPTLVFNSSSIKINS